MSMIVIEAADGSGQKRKVSEESWRRWPQAKDDNGKPIEGQRMWGRKRAFRADDEAARPKPLTAERKPIEVPLEVAQQAEAKAVQNAEGGPRQGPGRPRKDK